jgi:hypothetical protein
MPNQRIADAADAAMHDPTVESTPGYCSRFVRQVVSKVYDNQYRGLFGASAIDTGHNFKRAGLDASVTQLGQLEIGDILFKMQGSGGFGHVGIYVGARGVASNSSTPIGRVSGAKGYRTLGQWGAWQLVGRIPGESPAVADEPILYHLKINDVKVADMPVHDGHALCPVRVWGNALGFDIDWHESSHRVVFNGREVPDNPVIIDERAYLPITVLAQAAGLRIIENNAATHTIVVGR